MKLYGITPAGSGEESDWPPALGFTVTRQERVFTK